MEINGIIQQKSNESPKVQMSKTHHCPDTMIWYDVLCFTSIVAARLHTRVKCLVRTKSGYTKLKFINPIDNTLN